MYKYVSIVFNLTKIIQSTIFPNVSILDSMIRLMTHILVAAQWSESDSCLDCPSSGHPILTLSGIKNYFQKLSCQCGPQVRNTSRLSLFDL